MMHVFSRFLRFCLLVGEELDFNDASWALIKIIRELNIWKNPIAKKSREKIQEKNPMYCFEKNPRKIQSESRCCFGEFQEKIQFESRISQVLLLDFFHDFVIGFLWNVPIQRSRGEVIIFLRTRVQPIRQLVLIFYSTLCGSNHNVWKWLLRGNDWYENNAPQIPATIICVFPDSNNHTRQPERFSH